MKLILRVFIIAYFLGLFDIVVAMDSVKDDKPYPEFLHSETIRRLLNNESVRVGAYTLKPTRQRTKEEGGFKEISFVKSMLDHSFSPEPINVMTRVCKYTLEYWGATTYLYVAVTPFMPVAMRPNTAAPKTFCPNETIVGRRLQVIADSNTGDDIKLGLGDDFNDKFVVGMLFQNANKTMRAWGSHIREAYPNNSDRSHVWKKVDEGSVRNTGIFSYFTTNNERWYDQERTLWIELVMRDKFEAYYETIQRYFPLYVREVKNSVKRIEEIRKVADKKKVATQQMLVALSKQIPLEVIAIIRNLYIWICYQRD